MAKALNCSFPRPISLPRISLGDIWEPATRKFCGNDLWKMFKAAFSILSSKSILQVLTINVFVYSLYRLMFQV